MANERRQAAHPTPAQVAQAITRLYPQMAWTPALTDRIAAALAAAHAEGRQAALEAAADEVVTLPFIVPSELEGEAQFNRNGNYIHDDVVIEWLRARAKASR